MFAAHADELEHGHELISALQFHSVRFTQSVEQSKAIARIRGFHVIISASGMCEAGRIRHHLKQWLWRAEATVLFVGFQAQGTLGRILQDGAPRVRIMGEEIDVRASIRRLDIYSGHADGPALARWIGEREPISGNVFLVHGEERAMDGLKARIAASLRAESIVTPALDEAWTLRAARRSWWRARQRASRPKSSAASTGTTTCRSSFSTSTNPCAPPPTSETAHRLIRKLRRALENGEG